MPIHDVSGIGGFYMLYLCIVKNKRCHREKKTLVFTL